MCTSPPAVAVHCFPREGGVDVVPFVLPLWVPAEAFGLTVAEYFGIEEDGKQ